MNTARPEPSDPTSALASIRLGIDSLLATPLALAGDGELVELLRQLEVQTRRLPAFEQALVAEIDRRGVAVSLHQRDTRTLMQTLLRISPDEAGARCRDADQLGPRRTFTGDEAPAEFAPTAAALQAGAISLRHARLIVCTIDRLPRAVRAEHHDSAEAFLLEQAALVTPRQLAAIARRLSDTLDPDGRLSEPDDHRRRRSLLLRLRADGSGSIEGELTPTAFQSLRAVLDPLARPVPAIGGTRDGRTSEQRYHDALESATNRLLRSGDLPDSGGVPATVVVTMTFEQFEARTGLARTGHGALRPVAEVLDRTGDAAIVPVALAPTGRVVAIGHQHRLATMSQRLALAARDKGCSAPGCTVPPQWCDTHHVTEWRLSGRTTLDDLCLACGYHHGLIDQGWTVRIIDDAPHWIAPRWLDAAQTPRRNTAHDITAHDITAHDRTSLAS